jgi:hypothetical protein
MFVPVSTAAAVFTKIGATPLPAAAVGVIDAVSVMGTELLLIIVGAAAPATILPAAPSRSACGIVCPGARPTRPCGSSVKSHIADADVGRITSYRVVST